MRAATLCQRTPAIPLLRTLDAIHLATAEESFALARGAGIDVGALVTADLRLVAAARAIDVPVEVVGALQA